MKFIAAKYRMLSIWLSLIIVSLAFVIGSDKPSRRICVPAAFLVGALMYLLGVIREWSRGRRAAVLIELLLMICMMTGAVLSIFQWGGTI